MPRPAGAPSYEEVLTPITDFAVRTAEYAKTLGVRCLYEPQGAYFNGYHGFGTDKAEEKPEQDRLREDCFRYKVEKAKALYAMSGEENHGKAENV